MNELIAKFNIEQDLISLFYQLVMVTKEHEEEEEDYLSTSEEMLQSEQTPKTLKEFENRIIEYMDKQRFLMYDEIEGNLATLHSQVGTPEYVDLYGDGEPDDRVKRHSRLVSLVATTEDMGYDYDRITAVLQRFDDNPSYRELMSISHDLPNLAQTTQEDWENIKDWLEWHIDSYN